MSLKDALYEQLKDNAGISALVGTRVYHSVAPESATRPFIVFQQIGGDHVHDMSGASGLARRDIQIAYYADKPKDAEAGSEAIRNAIDGFNGTMGTIVTADVSGSFLSGSIDTFEPAAETKHGMSVYGINQSWTFWHTETAPAL